MSTVPFQKSFNFLKQMKSRGSMMLHVEFLFVTDVVVDTAFSEHRIYTIVLPEKNIAEFFLTLDFFHKLFRFDFLAKFVNKSVDIISISLSFNS